MNRAFSSKELNQLYKEIGHIRRMEKKQGIRRSLRTRVYDSRPVLSSIRGGIGLMSSNMRNRQAKR